MIDEDFKFADPSKDPRNQPRIEGDAVRQLEALGFRPFTEEW